MGSDLFFEQMARLNKTKIRGISIANQNDEVKTYDNSSDLRIQKMTKTNGETRNNNFPKLCFLCFRVYWKRG